MNIFSCQTNNCTTSYISDFHQTRNFISVNFEKLLFASRMSTNKKTICDFLKIFIFRNETRLEEFWLHKRVQVNGSSHETTFHCHRKKEQLSLVIFYISFPIRQQLSCSMVNEMVNNNKLSFQIPSKYE